MITMSDYASYLLCAWGAWARRQASGALGYPRVSPMFRDAPVAKGYASKPPLGLDVTDVQATDAAVQRLSAGDRRMCVEVYQHGGTTVEIAARLATTTVSLRNILSMKTGDILPINIPEKIVANVDDIPLMECRYGLQGGQYALKIEKFITPESDDNAQGEHHG